MAQTIMWIRWATEYALGMTMVLTQLALGGRGLVQVEALDEEKRRKERLSLPN